MRSDWRRTTKILGIVTLVRRWIPRTLAELDQASVTYQEVGATRRDPLPTGYRHVHRDVVLRTGRAVFERAVEGLFTWRIHEGAGMTVTSPAGRAANGVTVVLGAGWGQLRLTIPCRVVYTLDEANRAGFAYGTLPGHPERGEEAFMIIRMDTGEVRIRIRAFSRPASVLARCGGPLTHLVQEFVTDRYLHAARRLVEDDIDR
jgi:uncharacterized protein (UPF0548 family)